MKPATPLLLRAALSASVAAGALLSAQPNAFAEVGVAAAVNVDARGRPPGAAPRVLALGNNIVFNEEIQTDAKGLVQILLLDGTTFTVGPNSVLVIDEFVYNPNTGEAKVVASLTKGAFRFVGARTSQTEGGAVVKTPVGTIGIRGAATNISYDPTRRTTKASLLFGKSLTVTGSDGAKTVVYEPGYTATVGGEANDGRGGASVAKTTSQETQEFGQKVSSPGNGGTKEPPPTEEKVVQADVTQTVVTPNEVPLPPVKPVASTEVTAAEEVVADIKGVTQSDTREDAKHVSGVDDEGNPIEPVPPPSPPVTRPARVLTAPSVYQSLFGPLDFAGSRGLVGSVPENDGQIGFFKQDGRLVSYDGTINLPDITGTQGDSGLEAIVVSNGNSLLGPLSGTGYAGRGDFAAYMLGVNGDPTQPFYVIYGTPTDETQLAAIDSGNDIREYTMTPDPIRPGLPYFAQDAYGAVTNANATNILVVEPGDGAAIKMLQSWISIDGAGVNQKSAALVLATNLFENEDGQYQVGASRRGTFRTNAEAGPANMRGGLGTIAGPDGAHLFGPNAEHFVIGSSIDPDADAFTDSYLDGPPGTAPGYMSNPNFGTHHVASLVSETPQASFSRTSRSLGGFMSGLAENNYAGSGNPYVVQSVGGDNFTITLNAEANSVFAQATVFDWLEQDSVADALMLTFGGSGNGTFVDDARFGAIRNGNRELTRLLTDSGSDVAHSELQTAGSYIVSGRTTPLPGYELCPGGSCDFIDWGWWGTKVTVEGGAAPDLPYYRTDFVHLGTWVAGDLSDVSLVYDVGPLPFNGYAAYTGYALGTVARDTPDGVAKYLARGDMYLTYDFGLREGGITISNFDGMTISGQVHDSGDLDIALFNGAGMSSGLSWTVEGAFVNNGGMVAAGVIGDFDIVGPGVTAVGSFAGAGVATIPTFQARVLTRAEPFVTFEGEVIDKTPGRGLVGSSPATDQVLGFQSIDGTLQADDILLLDYSGIEGDSGLELITDVPGSSPNGSVHGIAYAGVGDFVAYFMGAGGDQAEPFYVIYGRTTDMDQFRAAENFTDIRTYTLTPDPLRSQAVPFFAPDLYGSPANFVSTDLLAVEPNESLTGDFRFFQNWVDIDGTGVNQKSAIGLFVGETYENGVGTEILEGARRGSFRYAATAGPVNMRGSIGTLPGGSGDHFFGPDAEHFVIGQTSDPADLYTDSLLGPGFTGISADGYLGDGQFGTHHVADLVSETPQTSFSRTSRVVQGYMTGMAQSSVEGINNPYGLTSVTPTMTITLDAENNDVSALGYVVDFNEQNPVVSTYMLTFGNYMGTYGGSTFVDDDRFGATQNTEPEHTRLMTDGGTSIAQDPTSMPGSYLVSGRAAPIAGYEHCTSCDFLDWGWWGTRVRVEPGSSSETPDGRTDFVHMGTWVAGDLSDPTQVYDPDNLPFGGYATYNGTALGTVSRDVTPGTVATYIARGDASMDFDFASREGNFAISNFDGMSVSGQVFDSGGQGQFFGALEGSGDLEGFAGGAFVNDGPNVAAGIIGDFSLTGTGVSAVGTFAAAGSVGHAP